MKRGVLPDWRIKKLIEQGVIIGADPDLVNPSSLDLRIAAEQWKLLGSFLPLPGQGVRDALASRNIVDDSSTRNRFYVEHLQQYAMGLVESLNLPESISAKVFNKSGRGRIGVSLRCMTDGMPQFDIIRGGYKGEIFAEVSATAFPIVVDAGKTAIPQIRFYEGEPQPLSGSELELELRGNPILTDDKGKPAYDEQERHNMARTGKLAFRADIPPRGLMAYLGREDKRTLDLAKKGYYIPERFFREEFGGEEGGGILVLHPSEFALVKSREHVRLPRYLAGEIDEYAPQLGDMRCHYAGLINASHGYDPEGKNVPSHIVFEIRARDTPLIIQDGQKLATFQVYRMLEEPEEGYMGKRSTDFKDLKSILPDLFKKNGE